MAVKIVAKEERRVVMKKITSLLMIFLIPNAFCAFPLLKFEDVSGEYMNGKGKAYAKNAKYDVGEAVISHQEIDVTFNRKEKNLVLREGNSVVELKVIDFSFMNVFKSFDFAGTFLESTSNKFSLETDHINFDIAPKQYKVSNLSISSDLSSVSSDELPPSRDIDILDGVIINGLIKLKKLNFGNVEVLSLLEGLVEENPKEAIQIKNSLKGLAKIPIVLRNFSLSVNRGVVSGRVLLDSWINANVKVGATLEHLNKENRLLITLTRAKLGIFSIRRFVLREVRKLNIEAISVRGNIIEVDLGKVLINSAPSTSTI